MPCLDRRDLNPDEWYWLLEVHQGPVWLPCEIRKRLIRLDLISESRRPTLIGIHCRLGFLGSDAGGGRILR